MSSLRQQIECGICLASYQEPKVLSCFHVYCLQCIKNYCDGGQNKTIECPLCRQPTRVPKSGVAGLLDYIVKEEASREDKICCGFCLKDTVVEFHCQDCDENLCLECKEQHFRMKQTKQHVINIIEERHIKKKVVQFCPLHIKSEIQLYCTTCRVGCCKMCFHKSHNNHPHRPLAHVAEEKRNEIRKHIEEMKEHFTSIVNDVYDILVEQDNLNTILNNTRQDIDSVADRLIRKINAASEKMKVELRDTGQTLKDKLQFSLETKEKKSKPVISVVQLTSEILNEATDLDLLTFETDMIYNFLEEKQKASVKDIRMSYLSSPTTEAAILSNILGESIKLTSSNVLQPVVLNKVTRSIKTVKNNLTAITCLNNSDLLVCRSQKKKMDILDVHGEKLDFINAPFRVGNMIQISDASLVVIEYLGTRVAKLRLDGGGVEKINKVQNYVHGVSLTRDGNCIIFSCSDVKFDNRKHKANNRLMITSLSLDLQMQLTLNTENSGGKIISHAVQKSNGDFIGVSTGQCFIWSGIGCLKSTYNFYGIVHSLCLDKDENLLILREEEESNAVSLYDSRFEVVKDLIRFPKEHAKSCMTLDPEENIWIASYNMIFSVQYRERQGGFR